MTDKQCECPSIGGDMCHMGEGCRAFEKVERLTLQEAGTHPAPCARTCESNAYEIEIRRVIAERDEATKRSRIAEKNLIDAQEAGKKLAKQAFDAERERDALARDAERYRWIRGGSRIGVKWCELYSGGAALDEAIDSTMKALPSTTAKARFDKAGGHEEPDPIERLRFFCSKAMSGQDWFDVELFFDEVIADRDALRNAIAHKHHQGALDAQSQAILICARIEDEQEGAPGETWARTIRTEIERMLD